jgi:Tfp pilus assembly protein PilN
MPASDVWKGERMKLLGFIFLAAMVGAAIMAVGVVLGSYKKTHLKDEIYFLWKAIQAVETRLEKHEETE